MGSSVIGQEKVYAMMICLNIPDSGASEYSSSNNSNSGVGKNS